MWTNETIFSEGDLIDVDLYLSQLNADGYESAFDRLSHVLNMKKRIEAEIKLLDELKKSNKLYEKFL